MVKRKTALKLRQAHRYLGLFIGIQFIMWTVSGMYFSWTDIDDIHGDQFKKLPPEQTSFNDLISPSSISDVKEITSIELKEISGKPYYFINEVALFNARSGQKLSEISKEDALAIAKRNMKDDLKVGSVKRITETGSHHEYRGGSLPAYVILYDTPENLRAYISAKDGTFKSVRHRDWRWFDFLWMTHTMDYEGRDDFNTLVLRAFSLLGLITVLSGFVLWYISSPTVRKMQKKLK